MILSKKVPQLTAIGGFGGISAKFTEAKKINNRPLKRGVFTEKKRLVGKNRNVLPLIFFFRNVHFYRYWIIS